MLSSVSPLGGKSALGGLLATLLLTACGSSSGSSLTFENVYSSLNDGGIYCESEAVYETDKTDMRRFDCDGPYAEFPIEDMGFSVRVFSTPEQFQAIYTQLCKENALEKFAAHGDNWFAYNGSPSRELSLDSYTAIAEALGGASGVSIEICKEFTAAGN